MSEANSINHHRYEFDPVFGVVYCKLDFMGFPGYRVGDDGSAWSCRPANGVGPLVPTWRQLSLGTDCDGYRFVNLCANRRRSRRKVHRLVLEAFTGPCQAGMEGCHFPDRDPGNNRLANLRWGTAKANKADSIQHGTYTRGEQHYNATITAEIVHAIRSKLAAGETQAATARSLDVSYTVVHFVAHKKSWAHVG